MFSRSNYFAKKKRRDEKVEILSLDYQLGNSGMTLGDVIADESVDVCETVCKKFSQSVKREGFYIETYIKMCA